MRIFLSFFLIFFTASILKAQYSPQEFANTISVEDLRKNLEFIASDSLKGRLTGSEGQRIAAHYIAGYFKENKLLPVVKTDSGNSYLQQFYCRSPYGLNYQVLYDITKIRNPKNIITSHNVLGFIEGTDKKDEILIISSHYDHIGQTKQGIVFNGADDDGSGTVAVMAIAKAFSKAKEEGKGPRRSILFLTVSGEEQGLLGSEYYTEQPVFPLVNTVCDLNIDMIGRFDPHHKKATDYVYLIGSDKLSSQLHSISETANQTYTHLNLDYSYNVENEPNQFYYRSDHYNFARKGIPIIFYFDGVHEDYHQSTDDVEKIDFNLLQKRARLVFYTAWEIANRENRPLVDSNKP
ncbi:Peptidase family M28 [Pseudarcicella hirudinis]|uniref:Peptidase family M28 n=1 Tax=Pseudarcicella hirudinis TaxID=1079859 RepID=A0A1I5WXP1_9BACT|nr:M28 family peptidase [Pseudarcicella hirudinis]SFQ24545.1 Peptidase family M28 [Pseudarcicella hirudinis]